MKGRGREGGGAALATHGLEPGRTRSDARLPASSQLAQTRHTLSCTLEEGARLPLPARLLREPRLCARSNPGIWGPGDASWLAAPGFRPGARSCGESRSGMLQAPAELLQHRASLISASEVRPSSLLCLLRSATLRIRRGPRPPTIFCLLGLGFPNLCLFWFLRPDAVCPEQ